MHNANYFTFPAKYYIICKQIIFKFHCGCRLLSIVIFDLPDVWDSFIDCVTSISNAFIESIELPTVTSNAFSLNKLISTHCHYQRPILTIDEFDEIFWRSKIDELMNSFSGEIFWRSNPNAGFFSFTKEKNDTFFFFFPVLCSAAIVVVVGVALVLLTVWWPVLPGFGVQLFYGRGCHHLLFINWYLWSRID